MIRSPTEYCVSNGPVECAALTPFMVFSAFMMASTGGGRSFEGTVFAGGLYALLCVIVLWTKHLFRREAEPLVRFLKDVATKSGPSSQAPRTAGAEVPGLVLTVSGEDHAGAVTPDIPHEALLGIGPDGFAVLASAPEIYLQTAWRDGGFIIEMREGDAGRHFRATRSGSPVHSRDRSRVTFTFEEVLAVFIAYASGTPTPSSVAWETLR